MKILISIFCLILAFETVGLQAQNDKPLVTIADQKISKAEFEQIYKKNNENLQENIEIKTPEEYLSLFIDFKLKVIEAMRLKMDTAQAFRDELAGYRQELAAPYLTDIQYDENLVQELYQRLKTEVNASHILFALPENATQIEDDEILKKALKIREEILAGKDFNEAAHEYSDDPSAKQNRGNLGYFSGFQMVAPFENAAFALSPGEVSQPVKSSFGYHLIQVQDVRENRGEIKVAHIMKMFPPDISKIDKARLNDEIHSIYSKIKHGADFAELAKEFSDDKQSAMQGGEMPWFSSGRMIAEFSEPAFRLKNIGDVSMPIETAYGYHIIKKIDYRPVPEFDKLKKEIENRIKQDPERNKSSQKVFIEKLKKEYDFLENSENLKKIGDTEINGENGENPVLFSLDGKDYNLATFDLYLQKNKITTGRYSTYYEEWQNSEIIAFEDSRIEQKHPEFRYLMQEYHDGLLLFSIMEEKIWNFASQDSAGLEKFYKEYKDKFSWDERFRGYVITCNDKETREEAEKISDEGVLPSEIADALEVDAKIFEISEGTWEKGVNPAVDYYIWNGEIQPGFNPELTFVSGDIIPPETKTLDEARGLYISEYQNILEQNWLKELRKKYKIKVNKKELKKVENAEAIH